MAGCRANWNDDLDRRRGDSTLGGRYENSMQSPLLAPCLDSPGNWSRHKAKRIGTVG
jgi:hypothetical protein